MLSERLAAIRDRIDAAVARGGHGQRVTIVAVTKTYGPDVVRAAWEAGIGDIGENKVQEALAKQAAANVPARWHLIGHLQRNKVKALDRFSLFHALDSARLADAIHAWAEPRQQPVRALLQVNASGEASKGGFAPDAVAPEAERLMGLTGLTVCGAMTMAPFDASESQVRACFAGARAARAILRSAGHEATELSMGMSGDYELAVEEGATMVRLGTILFGARN